MTSPFDAISKTVLRLNRRSNMRSRACLRQIIFLWLIDWRIFWYQISRPQNDFTRRWVTNRTWTPLRGGWASAVGTSPPSPSACYATLSKWRGESFPSPFGEAGWGQIKTVPDVMSTRPFCVFILRMLLENRFSKFLLVRGSSAEWNFLACGGLAWSKVCLCRPRFHESSQCDSLRVPGEIPVSQRL